jgi:hypothetical protein
MDEKGEPLIDNPPPEPDYVGDNYDGSDGKWSDPAAGDAVRFAGCSVNDELDSLGANTNV